MINPVSRNPFLFIGLLLIQLLWINTALASFEGELSLEGRYFIHDPAFPGQADQHGSVAGSFVYFTNLSETWSFEFEPFVRKDFRDEDRSHADLRKAFFLSVYNQFELGIGINQVFWGVTESDHQVDIIAQTDMLESLDREDKLGQPMVSLSFPMAKGLLDFYLLPYFREQQYPGEKGRLRFRSVIDEDDSLFEHEDEENHLDFGVRLSQSVNQFEFALSHFQGTSRQPSFIFKPTPNGIQIIPYYPQIRQTGVEVQGIFDALLIKWESIYRTGQPNLFFEEEDYWSATGGFEYSFYGLAGTVQDLGLILEFSYDTRKDASLSTSESDLATGLRWALNDLRSTEILFIAIKDLDTSARSIIIESSTMLNETVELTLNAVVFSNQPPLDILNFTNDMLLSDFEQDDFIQFELTYYF